MLVLDIGRLEGSVNALAKEDLRFIGIVEYSDRDIPKYINLAMGNLYSSSYINAFSRHYGDVCYDLLSEEFDNILVMSDRASLVLNSLGGIVSSSVNTGIDLDTLEITYKNIHSTLMESLGLSRSIRLAIKRYANYLKVRVYFNDYDLVTVYNSARVKYLSNDLVSEFSYGVLTSFINMFSSGLDGGLEVFGEPSKYYIEGYLVV